MNIFFFIQGDVLTFMDAHVECTVGWLEPILSRIASDRSIIATPHIDGIFANTMEYQKLNPYIITFDWTLTIFWFVDLHNTFDE